MFYLVAHDRVPIVLTEAEVAPYLSAHPEAFVHTLLSVADGFAQLQKEAFYHDVIEQARLFEDLLCQPCPLSA